MRRAGVAALVLGLLAACSSGGAPSGSLVEGRALGGDFGYAYPPGWFAREIPCASPDADCDFLEITSYDPAAVPQDADLADGQFRIQVGRVAAPGLGLDVLIVRACSEDAAELGEEVTDCGAEQIGDRLWARVDSEITRTDPPLALIKIATVAGDFVYTVVGFIPEGERAEEGRALVERVLGTFTLA